jgi:translocator protein
MSSDRTRQVATVLIFLVTLAINGAANALPINGQATGEISDRFRVFVIPAGYVFAIWGVIYLGLAAFTLYQAARGGDPVVRRLGWLPALTGVLNTGWLLLFQYELFVLTVPVMIALLVTLIAIHLRLWEARAALTPATRWTIRYPFSIYLGWITVATIANIAQTLSSIGVGGFGLEVESAIAGAVLLVGLAIATTFVRRFDDIAYGAVIVWAYAGIVVKELATPIVPLVAGAGAVLVAGLVAMAIARRIRHRGPTVLPAA